MVKDSTQYSFAKQFLELNKRNNIGISIFSGNKKILGWYDEEPPVIEDTKPMIIPDTLDFGTTIRKLIKNYDELLSYGLIIIKKKARGKFFAHQQFMYVLRRKDYVGKEKEMGVMPLDHYVEYDKGNNAFRIIGKNAGMMGTGHWFRMSGGDGKGSQPRRMFSVAEQCLNDLYPFGISYQKKPIFIDEIPVMISFEARKIVCIPKSSDLPSIAIVGQKGGGKTFHMLSMASRVHHYWKHKVALLNDSLSQTSSICQKWYPHSPFERYLNFLNEDTVALPAVFLSPADNSKELAFMQDKGVGFKISLPFQDLIKEYMLFFKDSVWEMGQSTKYLKMYKEEFMKCRSYEEVEELMDDLVEKELINKNSAQKMLALFNELFEKNILDISNRIPPLWDVVVKEIIRNAKGEIIDEIIMKAVKYPPIIASLFCDLVPVFVTSKLLDKEYAMEYFKYVTKQIFNVQSEDKDFKGEIVWCFIDELTMVAKRGRINPSSEMLKLLVEQGRPKRIGTVYVVQSYSELLRGIRQNTIYCFAFAQMSDEANNIIKDFMGGSNKSLRDELLSLKPREMVAFTKKSFITYDMEGVRREETCPFRGIALPPLCQSPVPMKMEVKHD